MQAQPISQYTLCILLLLFYKISLIALDIDLFFKIFSYGYGYADVNKEATSSEDSTDPQFILHFPNPCIIFLGDVSSKVPSEYKLKLDFGDEKSHIYTVPTVKLADISTQELNDRKMIILIPFHLLKLRKLMRTNRGPSTIQSLKNSFKLIYSAV